MDSPKHTTRSRLRAGRGLALAVALGACNGAVDPSPSTSAFVPPPGEGPEAPDVAAQTAAQRLTVTQYGNAIHDLFGEGIVVPSQIEPDTALEGFVSIGSSVSTVSHRGVEQYEQAAFSIAEQVIASPEARAAVLPCEPAGVGDAVCARTFAAQVGRRVWRRPLTREEIGAVASVVIRAGTTLGDADQGLIFGLATLLQAPSFLYRGAAGEPDPDRPGLRRYTGYEMASRLSFFLWSSTPDDALLDDAEAGRLTTDDGVAAAVERLLASPHARRGFRNFVTEWLGLAALDDLAKDPQIFTYFTPDLGPFAREETLRGFEHLAFDEDADLREIFTTRRTFVNPKLASLYAIPAPAKDGFGEVTLPEGSPRRGLLGQASVLALYAHPTSSSATLRGKFIRQTLLCGEIPPPPVNVNTALPEPTGEAATLRDRVKQHLADPFCAGCHQIMDPLGLGLESFDGLGIYRKKDGGAVIDASGELDGVAFRDAVELGRAVREHPSLVPCAVRKAYEYATSFVETAEERETLDAIAFDFAASGHRAKALLAAIATSPGFRLARNQD